MIYLASSSPRRAELLRQIGVEFEVLIATIDESQHPAESAEEYVCRMAKNKAEYAVKSKLFDKSRDVILAADTIISIDGKIVGKPQDCDDCRHILSWLSGREHHVFSAVALWYRQNLELTLSKNLVSMRKINTAEIADYCASKEPKDKAGAYAIQGRAAIFVERLEGSYSSVMGLPLFETGQLLKQAGIDV